MLQRDARPGPGAQRIAVSLVALLALWTVLAQAFQLAGGTFHQLVVTACLLLVPSAVAPALWRRRGGDHEPSEPERGTAAGLLVLCLVGAVLALFVSRPDQDDVSYVSRAVYFLEHPHAPLDLTYHDHALLDVPTYYPLQIAYSLELFWAAAAYLTSLPFLTFYHGVAPAVGGALIPLVAFLGVSRFSRRDLHALLGAAAIVAYLCIDGSTHRTYGNFGFVRIWQSKVVLMSIAAPLFAVLSIDWFRRPSPGRWLRLFALGVAASGLSGTAFFLLPLLALWLAAAELTRTGVSRSSLRRVVVYGTSLAYLVVVALGVRLATERSDFEYVGYRIFPEPFAGQVGLVFGGVVPITAIVFATTLALGAWLLPSGQRRFFGGWLAAAIVLALNPIAMRPIAEHLTTTNAFWRILYTLPFPLLLGVVVAVIADRRAWSTHASAGGAIALLVGAVGIAGLAPGLTSIGGHRLAPGPKMEPALRAEVEAIVARAAPGPMLAPTAVSSTVPILTSRLPQVSVSGFFLVHFATAAGQRDVAESRLRAVATVTGGEPAGVPDVVTLLERGLGNVVVDTRAPLPAALTAALRRRAFRQAYRGRSYVLYVGPDTPARQDAAP